MLTALGKILRVIRIEKGLLLKDMADRMGVEPSYISSIENGKRKPSERFVESVISALSLSTEDTQKVKDAYWETIEEVSLRLNSEKSYQVDLGLALARSFHDLTAEQATAIDSILKKGVF